MRCECTYVLNGFGNQKADNLLGNLDEPAKCFKSGSDNANLSVTVAAVANSLNWRAMVGCVCADVECNKDQGLEDNATDKKNNSSHVTPDTCVVIANRPHVRNLQKDSMMGGCFVIC